MRAPMLPASLLAALIAASTIVPAVAQPAPPQRIRGTITSVSGNTLAVHTRDETDITVQLASDTIVHADTPATLATIKPGSTLAIVSRGPADHQTAVAIRAMAPGVPLRMAILPWDLMPESTMTNAVVQAQEVSADGPAMTLKAGDQTVQMTASPDAVIATEEMGDKAMLTPGAHVAIFAAPGDNAALSARVVIVGLQGMTPPL